MMWELLPTLFGLNQTLSSLIRGAVFNRLLVIVCITSRSLQSPVPCRSLCGVSDAGLLSFSISLLIGIRICTFITLPCLFICLHNYLSSYLLLIHLMIIRPSVICPAIHFWLFSHPCRSSPSVCPI